MRATKAMRYGFENIIPTILNCLFDLNLKSFREYQENIRRIIRGETIKSYLGDETLEDIERWK